MLKPVSTHLFNRAMAFLEIAIISSKAKDNHLFNTKEYSNVTAYLLHFATELFLKFAIYQAHKSVKGDDVFKLYKNKRHKGHDVFELYKVYKEHYQDEKWNINIPFCKQEDTNYINFTENEIANYKKKYSMSFEQQLKYPIDNKGIIYNLVTMYDTEFLEDYKNELLSLYFQIEKCSS
jgi:hypothetical protein